MRFFETAVFSLLTLTPALAGKSEDLVARDASMESEILPRAWLEARDPMALTHLGDDGVLRLLKVRVPEVEKRDEHQLFARHEVVDAIALNPKQIKRWIERSGYNAMEKRHLQDEFHGIDGRDAHASEHLDPHPALLPRALLTLDDAREIKKRSEMPKTPNPNWKRAVTKTTSGSSTSGRTGTNSATQNQCSGGCSTNEQCHDRSGLAHCNCGALDQYTTAQCHT